MNSFRHPSLRAPAPRLVEASKRALRETDDPLSNIALNLGYSDQSSFGRAFKRWTGVTPQAFCEGRPVAASSV